MADVREKVKTGIDNVADQAKGAADRSAGVVDQVKHTAEHAVEKVGDYAHEAKDKVEHWAEDAYDVAGKKLSGASHDMTEMVKKYPIHALCIGFGIGLLMGRLSRV